MVERWMEDGGDTEAREEKERERDEEAKIAQKWLSWEKKYWFVYVELPVYQRVTGSY